MPKLEWSVLGQENNITQSLVEKFKNIFPQAQVDVSSLLWESYKEELTNIAIYRRGADVSQAGAPVVSDLVAMNALRPFSAGEMASLGGESVFTKIAWQSSLRLAENKVLAIPLFSDPYAIIYWSDMLEDAGVNETQAFTQEHIEETFERLQARRIEYPWLIPFHSDTYSSIHGVASWVWAQGTDFVSADGRKALFTDQAALTGLQAYYRLARFVSPECLRTNYHEYNQLFLDRRAAASICGVGASNNWYSSLPVELRSKLKVALPPGPPLVGGSSLVIWNATRVEELAFSLVKFLVSPEIQAFYPLQAGQMPVLREVLDQPPFTTEPLLQSYANVLAHGRMFPLVKLGGLLERQLAIALTNIWHMVLSDPATDLETILRRNLEPVARRYDMIMASA
jgi:multiple sugar transport system substrate-binding protein